MKNKNIIIRSTDEEKKRLSDRAKAEGFSSVAEFLRVLWTKKLRTKIER
jgi:hypothetical protein